MEDRLIITDKQQLLKVDVGDKIRYNKTDFTIIEIRKSREQAHYKMCSDKQRVSQIILTL